MHCKEEEEKGEGSGRFGLAVRLVSGRTRVRVPASALLSLQTLWFVDTVSFDTASLHS